jgi:hypothetical protein
MSATGAAAGAAPHSSGPTSTTSLSDTARPLSAFWQNYAFSLGAIDFLRVDVALAAMVFGEWACFERRLTEGLACVARATSENLALPQDAIDEAAVAFRYDRDLISAADIGAWLEHHGISADAWLASVTRGVLRQMWRHDIEGVLDRYGPSPRQLEAAALAEGICSGLFDEFERSFTGKAAIAFESHQARFEFRARMSASHAEAAGRLARQHAHWLEGRPAADTLERLRVLLEIQRLFGAAFETVATEAALTEVVEANRLDWVVIDADSLSFPAESAAREAMLCITEDQLSLGDVAGLSRQSLIRTHSFLADIPAEHRHRLLAAEPGQVIGPLLVDGRFHVTIVTGRSAPTLADGHVADRARAMLLEQVARRAAREHVRHRMSA